MTITEGSHVLLSVKVALACSVASVGTHQGQVGPFVLVVGFNKMGIATSSTWGENTYKRLYNVAKGGDLPTFGSNLWYMQVNRPVAWIIWVIYNW